MTEQLSSLAYRLFIDTCRSPVTRMHYSKALRYFMKYLNVPLGDYDKLLPPEKDAKVIQMDICNFITFLRKKDLASASVTLYIAALEKFYAMNDIVLNWKRIRSFMAEHEDMTINPYAVSLCYNDAIEVSLKLNPYKTNASVLNLLTIRTDN